jgi:hypothetical protein
MKKLAIIILHCSLIFPPLLTYAQETSVVERFIIQKASINKIDSTERYLRSNAYSALNNSKSDNQLYFRTVRGKKEDSGKVIDIRATVYAKTAHSYKAEFITFRWNNNESIAFVQRWRVYKANGVSFECSILYQDSKIIDLEGTIQNPVSDIVAKYSLNPSTVFTAKE